MQSTKSKNQNSQTTQPLSDEQLKNLKWELRNLEGSMESIEEISGGFRLPDAIDHLYSEVLSCSRSIQRAADQSPVNKREIENNLDKIATASSTMTYLANINDEIRVLAIYIDNMKSILDQLEKEGGDNNGN